MVLVLEMKCVSLWEFLSLSTQSPHHLQKKILFWPWPRSFLSQTLKDSFVFTKPILGSKLERRYNPDRIVKKKKGPRDLGNENAEGEGGHAGKHICWMLGKLREWGGVGRISWKRIWTVSRKLEFEWERRQSLAVLMNWNCISITGEMKQGKIVVVGLLKARGVGLESLCARSVTKSCPTLCDPMDCSPCQAPLSMELSRQG